MKVTEKISEHGGGSQFPDKLIIHAMGEEINGMYADDFLNSMGLSAHYLLKPNGEFIKMKSTKLIAWHAKGFNKNSVGIEVLVEGKHTYNSFLKKIKEDWVTTEQMKALIDLSNGIIQYFGISKDNVLRHSDISPERKFDPGSGFDWKYFKSKLKLSK